ncbi:MAG: hypothetical protein PHT40_03545 [Patescibacteria group bacterium]|nr:hypothetical protein [Patescibacteria group bacterium]
MLFNIPKDNDKFSWTKHSIQKMKFYGLTSQRVVRIINHPERTEEAIVPGCIAVMQSLGTKRKTEMWVMFKTQNPINKTQGKTIINTKKRKIISAWRYPGVSPKRQVPIPEDILEELTENMIGV